MFYLFFSYSLVLLLIGFSSCLIYIGMLSIHLDSQQSVVNHYVVDHQMRKVEYNEIIYVNTSLASGQLWFLWHVYTHTSSIYLSFHLYMYPSICMYLSIYLYLHLSISYFTHIFIHPFTHQHLHIH